MIGGEVTRVPRKVVEKRRRAGDRSGSARIRLNAGNNAWDIADGMIISTFARLYAMAYFPNTVRPLTRVRMILSRLLSTEAQTLVNVSEAPNRKIRESNPRSSLGFATAGRIQNEHKALSVNARAAHKVIAAATPTTPALSNRPTSTRAFCSTAAPVLIIAWSSKRIRTTCGVFTTPAMLLAAMTTAMSRKHVATRGTRCGGTPKMYRATGSAQNASAKPAADAGIAAIASEDQTTAASSPPLE